MKRAKTFACNKFLFSSLLYDLTDNDIAHHAFSVNLCANDNGLIIFLFSIYKHSTDFSVFYGFFHVTKSKDSFLTILQTSVSSFLDE